VEKTGHSYEEYKRFNACLLPRRYQERPGYIQLNDVNEEVIKKDQWPDIRVKR
jgi:hypothetical protein